MSAGEIPYQKHDRVSARRFEAWGRAKHLCAIASRKILGPLPFGLYADQVGFAYSRLVTSGTLSDEGLLDLISGIEGNLLMELQSGEHGEPQHTHEPAAPYGAKAAIDRDVWDRATRIVQLAADPIDPKPRPTVFANAVAEIYNAIIGRPQDNNELPQLLAFASGHLC